MIYRLVILKPDAVERKIVGDLISQIEPHVDIDHIKLHRITIPELEQLYSHHVNELYWGRIERTMTRDKSMLLCVRDHSDTLRERCLVLRERYGCDQLNRAKNVIHCSEPADAFRELDLFFPEVTT